MGQLAVGDIDRAISATAGTFTGTGVGAAVQIQGRFNASLLSGTSTGTGAWTGNVQIERSFDARLTWTPISADSYGTVASFQWPTSLILTEEEAGVWYRWHCTVFGNGIIPWRLSQ